MIIDLEAHMFPKEYVRAIKENEGYPKFIDRQDGELIFMMDESYPIPRTTTMERLTNLELRLSEMDKTGTDIQVLSVAIPALNLNNKRLARKLSSGCNDEISSMVEKHPDRFVGLASIDVGNGDESIDELRRAINDLGFKGVSVQSNYDGKYLENHEFWNIYSEIESLEVPIFIHPTVTKLRTFDSFTASPSGRRLLGPVFGFTFDAGFSYMRMIYSGLFDRFPRLKIIMAHLGETLPFIINRIDFPFTHQSTKNKEVPPLNKKPSEYMRDNLFVNTSGNYSQFALELVHKTLGPGRIVHGSDYPFETMESAIDFVKESNLSEQDKDRIFWKNLSDLMHLKN